MTTIGSLLKEKRLDAGLSQKDISDSLGFATPQSLSNVERGIAALPPSRFKAIAKLVKCDPKEFFRAHMKDYEMKVKRTAGLK